MIKSPRDANSLESNELAASAKVNTSLVRTPIFCHQSKRRSNGLPRYRGDAAFSTKLKTLRDAGYGVRKQIHEGVIPERVVGAEQVFSVRHKNVEQVQGVLRGHRLVVQQLGGERTC